VASCLHNRDEKVKNSEEKLNTTTNSDTVATDLPETLTVNYHIYMSKLTNTPYQEFMNQISCAANDLTP
jgi:hypothetical protein